jgi:hypothetical protein
LSDGRDDASGGIGSREPADSVFELFSLCFVLQEQCHFTGNALIEAAARLALVDNSAGLSGSQYSGVCRLVFISCLR